MVLPFFVLACAGMKPDHAGGGGEHAPRNPHLSGRAPSNRYDPNEVLPLPHANPYAALKNYTPQAPRQAPKASRLLRLRRRDMLRNHYAVADHRQAFDLTLQHEQNNLRPDANWLPKRNRIPTLPIQEIRAKPRINLDGPTQQVKQINPLRPAPRGKARAPSPELG